MTNEQEKAKRLKSELRVIRDGIRELYACVPHDTFDARTVEIVVRNLLNLNFLREVWELNDVNEWREKLAISQPFVKRDLARRTLAVFNTVAAEGLDDVTAKLGELTEVLILEDIVYFEALSRYMGEYDRVFKFRYDDTQEIDVVVYVYNEKLKRGRLMLFEVKLSEDRRKTGVDGVVKGQDRNLLDHDFLNVLVAHFGAPIDCKMILYRGVTDVSTDENGVRWVNVEEWLLGQVET